MSRCPVHIFSARSGRRSPLSYDSQQDGDTDARTVQGKSAFISTIEFDPFITENKKHLLSFNGWGDVNLLRDGIIAEHKGRKLCDCEYGCSEKDDSQKSSLAVALKANGTGTAIEYEGDSCTRFTSEDGQGDRARKFIHCPKREGACTCEDSTTYEPSGKIHVFTADNIEVSQTRRIMFSKVA